MLHPEFLLDHLGRGGKGGGSGGLAEQRNFIGQPLSTPGPALLGRLTLPQPHLLPQPHTLSWRESQLWPWSRGRSLWSAYVG